jgi:hypothetical protein
VLVAIHAASIETMNPWKEGQTPEAQAKGVEKADVPASTILPSRFRLLFSTGRQTKALLFMTA